MVSYVGIRLRILQKVAVRYRNVGQHIEKLHLVCTYMYAGEGRIIDSTDAVKLNFWLSCTPVILLVMEIVPAVSA